MAELAPRDVNGKKETEANFSGTELGILRCYAY